MKKSLSQIIKPRYIFFLCLAIVIAMIPVLLSQQSKLNAIESELSELEEQHDSLLSEEEREERMIEYMQTDEYMMQYARDTYGYVYPDDIKFYR